MAQRIHRRVDSAYSSRRQSPGLIAYARALLRKFSNRFLAGGFLFVSRGASGASRRRPRVFRYPFQDIIFPIQSSGIFFPRRRQRWVASVLVCAILAQSVACCFLPNSLFPIPSAAAAGDWFDAAYGFRKEVRFDHAKVAGDLHNFPVLVSLVDPALKSTAQGGRVANGAYLDVMFADLAGTQQLDHELEKYDPNTGELVAWVKLPELSSATDTAVYLYYGNASLVASEEDRAGVWDEGGNNNFKGVWHLGETGSAAAGDYKDSTSYGSDSVNVANQPTASTGKIGISQLFNGTSSSIELESNAVFNLTNNLNICSWVKWDGTGDDRAMISKAGAYKLDTMTTGQLRFTTLTVADYEPSFIPTLGAWYHVCVNLDASYDAHFYINGSLHESIAGSAPALVSANPVYLGGYNAHYFNGSLDEVRISNTTRSAQWIQTEYNNQSQPTEFLSLGIEEVYDAPALSTFGYRKAITIDHTKVGGELTNFPVLINLPADASLAAHAQDADFDDVLFTSSDVVWSTGSVNDKLAHEIESFNPDTGELVAWVNIPQLSSTTDTVIYMYYGHATVASQQNPSVVWGKEARMVQHMHQDPTGAAPQMLDSSSYGHDATSSGITAGYGLAAGQIGFAQKLDGSDDYFDAGNESDFDITQAITASAWFYTETVPPAYYSLVGEYYCAANGSYELYLGGASQVIWATALTPDTRIRTTGSQNFLGGWHYAVSTFSYADQKQIVYVDGVKKMEQARTTPLELSARPLKIGGGPYSVGYLNGRIDEVRVASVARSAQWIQTEYNNQSQPTEFLALGIEEVYDAPALSTFGYRKAITIDHTKVGGELTNFPVFINLPTDAGLAAHAQDADFDDVLFTSSDVVWSTGSVNDKLAHEIESFNPDTGELVAWVNIPQLSSTTDTVIYMYYGHATVASQQNRTVVWDSSTKLVQHMHQAGTGAAENYQDSTQYDNDSTNAASQPVVTAAGKIGRAENFNGVDDFIAIGDDDSLDFGAGSYSASWWAKYPQTQSFGGYASVFSKGFDTSAGKANAFGFAHTGDVTTGLKYYEIGNTTGSWATNVTLETGITDGWHNFFFMRDVAGGKLQLYDNGVLVYSAAYSANTNVSNAYALYLMKNHDSSNTVVGGTLDEARFSNVVRSAAWIQTEYQNQSQPAEFVSLGIEEVSNPAALSTFGFRKAITIDHTQVSGDLVNFPVLISLPADASLAAHAQDADFDDVLFTLDDIVWSAGSINDKLAHEIESFDPNTGELVAWVNIPQLSATADTTIYMYYGNGSVASQQNPSAVWDNSTRMVQHMHQAGTGTAGDYRDSSRYANDSSSGLGFQPDVTDAGKIGRAENFNGTDDFIGIGSRDSLNFPGGAFTIELWAKPGDGAARDYLSKLNWTGLNGYALYGAAPDNLTLAVGHGDNTVTTVKASGVTVGDWHHLSFVVDGAQMTAYTDGVAGNTSALSKTITYSANDFAIAYPTWAGAEAMGPLDEIRVSAAARSAAWIATEYSNQSNPAEFASLGIEEVSVPAALSSFGFRKTITIDHTRVAGNLTNFPVLVNLPADAGLAAHVQSDGDDILFTSDAVAWSTGSANDKLAHEIEKYDSATGQLAAWVKIPQLSATADTVIYMYYGHSTITSQQNPAAVWDSSTKLVQHLEEDPTSANPAPQMLDSTRYANHGTTYGTMLAEDQVAGVADGALDFDGSNDYVDCGDQESTEIVSAVTASAWIRTNSMAQFKTVLARQFGSGYGTYALTPTGTANFNFVIRQSGGNRLSPAVNFATLNDNVFHYLVGVYDGARVRLYLDGAEVGSGTAATGAILASTGNLRIGVYQTGGVKYGGLMDEVRVSDVGRSAQWIATEYQNQSQPLKTEAAPAGFLSVGAEMLYRLEITGAGNQTSGQGQTITLTAKNAAGQVLTGFNGNASVTFSGANASGRGTSPSCNYVAFGTPTSLTFANGVATCTLRLYKAENASVTASGLSLTANSLAVGVIPNLHHNYLVQAPASAASGESFAATITARDFEYNPVNISGDTLLSVSAGTVSPASLSAAGFTNGVWSGNLTISDITERPNVILTAAKSGHTGIADISILGLPQAPGSVSASRTDDTELAVAWQDSSTVEVSYEIERRVLEAGAWGSYQLIASAGAGATSFVDNAATHPADPPRADRAYQYRVRAQNSIGYGAYATDSAAHYTTPDTPTDVSAERLSDAGFRLDYTDNADVTDSHRLQRCSNAFCSAVFETELGVFSASPQSDATGIAADSRYRWQARSETPDGLASAWALSAFEYTTPQAPAIATPVVVSADAITVQWTDNSAYEDGFRVEVSVDGGAFAEVTPGVNTVGANIASYSFACLGDHNYQFRVRAHVGATTDNGQLFSPYSGASSAVYTPSAPPTIQAPVVDSATAITWHWTDNSAYEEAFHLDFVTGAGPDADDIPAGAVSHQTASLTPNTAYAVHVHSYRADSGESAASADSEAVYTLASLPAGLRLTASGTSLAASWEINGNPAGTEYLIENVTAGTSSGWITDTAWTAADLMCGTEYSFRVKARNRANVETAFASSVSQTTAGCGGAMLPGAHNPPQAPAPSAENPAGAFGLLIDGGAAYANRTWVRLSLFAGPDTKHVALSNRADFQGASLVAYQPQFLWDLEGGDGTRTVYARFYTRYGVASEAVSASIRLDTHAPAFRLDNLREKYLPTDDITLRGTTEAGTRVGYNLDGQRAGVVVAEGGEFVLALGALAPGTHALQLFAQDAVGNSSDIVLYSLVVAKPTPVALPTPSVPVLPEESAPAPLPAPAGEPAPTNPVSPAPLAENNPVAPVVPPAAPAALSGEWNLLSFRSLPQAFTSADIEMLVERFPQFKQNFARLGIQDFSDPAQLQQVDLALPTLGVVTGLSAEVGTVPGLPAPGTPLAGLPAGLKQGIPENFVFVRTRTQGIDVTTALTFDQGLAEQKVSLLAGQTFELIIRPDQEVAHIKGYVTFQARAVGQADPSGSERLARWFRPAALAAPLEEKLVLSEFDYADADGDGIWTAELQIPPLAGEYEVITVLDYKDVNLGPKSIRMITVVDPEGYVYELTGGKETRIPEALVRLFWFNPDTRSYELWDAARYQQQNPQTTDRSGTYAFLVPAGSYYLAVEAPGYQSFRGEPFQVTVGSGVHANLELRPLRDWREQLTWERALTALLGAALLYNFYSDWRGRRRAKKAAG